MLQAGSVEPSCSMRGLAFLLGGSNENQLFILAHNVAQEGDIVLKRAVSSLCEADARAWFLSHEVLFDFQIAGLFERHNVRTRVAIVVPSMLFRRATELNLRSFVQ